MYNDLRYAFRRLSKNAGLTGVVVAILALGIGASVTIFAVVDAVLFRGLPFREPDRLVQIWERKANAGHQWMSLGDFMALKTQNQNFERVVALQPIEARITGLEMPEDVSGNRVSVDFFDMLGVRAAVGRIFQQGDEHPRSEPVAVLADGYWVSRFGSDPKVVGQQIVINQKPHTIIGVLPRSFQEVFQGFPGRAKFWTAVQLESRDLLRTGPGGFMILARLKHHATLQTANADLSTLSSQLSGAYPQSNLGVQIYAQSLHEEVTRHWQKIMMILFGTVPLVLLTTCANVIGLMLARGIERRHELAVRAALGASRWHVIRQLMAENVLLVSLGAVLGLWLANIFVPGTLVLLPRLLPRADEIALNTRASVFLVGVTLVTVVLFGLASSLPLSRYRSIAGFKESGPNSSTSRRGRFLTQSLAVVQIAVTLMLLIGAGLLGNSLYRLTQANPGFSVENLLTAHINLGSAGDFVVRSNLFWTSLMERINQLPEIQSAALVLPLPLGDSASSTTVRISDSKFNAQEKVRVGYTTVSHDYFHVMGIPLLNGRHFNDDDRMGSTPVVMVSEGFARKYLPNDETVGKTLVIDGFGPETAVVAAVVGVVADSRMRLDQEPLPQVYRSNTQFPQYAMYLVARTIGSSSAVPGALRSIVSSIDKNQPIGIVRTMGQIKAEYTEATKFYLAFIAGTALIAMVLAAIGTYGLLANMVNQRTREIGVRMALGANPRSILLSVVAKGFAVTSLGMGIGLVGAFSMVRILESLLYEVSPKDPTTFVAVFLLFYVVALLACYMPARKASLVDPIVALRCE